MITYLIIKVVNNEDCPFLRICPGRFFADASAWLLMANVLAAFSILPPIDPETGEDCIPPFELVGSLNVYVS